MVAGNPYFIDGVGRAAGGRDTPLEGFFVCGNDSSLQNPWYLRKPSEWQQTSLPEKMYHFLSEQRRKPKKSGNFVSVAEGNQMVGRDEHSKPHQGGIQPVFGGVRRTRFTLHGFQQQEQFRVIAQTDQAIKPILRGAFC